MCEFERETMEPMGHHNSNNSSTNGYAEVRVTARPWGRRPDRPKRVACKVGLIRQPYPPWASPRHHHFAPVLACQPTIEYRSIKWTNKREPPAATASSSNKRKQQKREQHSSTTTAQRARAQTTTTTTTPNHCRKSAGGKARGTNAGDTTHTRGTPVTHQ